ncbi:hypothetical protein [Streptacidiphilus jiangxiensis]|uniref:Uncharacterized protein n=1 Tax=Streptacidiphilus jiangxiensis TaxID=235985 RepID=A0A1H7NA96_STRJI|nr:hypothetical protein [Streptacidiphilus jiangxiensis]SEL19837.1 hypothetical protein SAMN05414137_106259 [Streptacidiphilus jiangxiensis]
MRVATWVEQGLTPAADGPVRWRVFHAADSPHWTLCEKSTSGLRPLPAAVASWPPTPRSNDSVCPTCEARAHEPVAI